MPTCNFTAGRIKDFKHPESGQIFYWDTGVRGLGIRITRTKKAYIYQGRLHGKTIRIKIGDVRTWVIDSKDPDSPGARQEAMRLQTLLDQGIDPRVEKKERMEEQAEKLLVAQRKDITLADVWPVYLKNRRPYWSERHYNDHVNLIHKGGEKKKRGRGKTKPAVLAALLPYRLTELTPEVIHSWAEKEVAKRGTQARLAFSLLRAMANWCEEQEQYKGLCHLNAFTGRIKKEVIPKLQARDDSLQREQLKPWFSAIRKIHNTVIASYLQTLLLTGARRKELMSLKWVDVDFKWRCLTIKDKVEATRTIPLTPYVAMLLERLPRRNDWVFSSSRSKSGQLQEPRKAHNLALEEAGIENLTIHGLRRSFGTLSEWVETPIGITYQIMGHKPSATVEKHYKKRPLDLLRKWHTKIEAWILEQADIEQPKGHKDIPHLTVLNK